MGVCPSASNIMHALIDRSGDTSDAFTGDGSWQPRRLRAVPSGETRLSIDVLQQPLWRQRAVQRIAVQVQDLQGAEGARGQEAGGQPARQPVVAQHEGFQRQATRRRRLLVPRAPAGGRRARSQPFAWQRAGQGVVREIQQLQAAAGPALVACMSAQQRQ